MGWSLMGLLVGPWIKSLPSRHVVDEYDAFLTPNHCIENIFSSQNLFGLFWFCWASGMMPFHWLVLCFWSLCFWEIQKYISTIEVSLLVTIWFENTSPSFVVPQWKVSTYPIRFCLCSAVKTRETPWHTVFCTPNHHLQFDKELLLKFQGRKNWVCLQ